MNTISYFLGTDHTRCDDLFAQMELDVTQGKWEAAETACEDFNCAMERHFAMEETVLFITFERASCDKAGPTRVMRMEHGHIRDIIRRVSEAVKLHDADRFFNYAHILRIMLHQHNVKEESVLYVMTDHILSDRCDEIIGKMNEIGTVDAVHYIA